MSRKSCEEERERLSRNGHDGTMGHRKAFQDSQEHSAPHRGIRGHRSRATSHTCPDALGKEKPEERGRNGHGSWRAGRPGLRCQTAVPPGLHNCDNGKLRHFKRSFHFLTSLRQSGPPSGHQGPRRCQINTHFRARALGRGTGRADTILTSGRW